MVLPLGYSDWALYWDWDLECPNCTEKVPNMSCLIEDILTIIDNHKCKPEREK